MHGLSPPPAADVPAAADHLGDIAIVLHSHMPYVEGFGTYPFGEEWLFDAAIRSYLPVLALAEGLTMSVTPVLADQLEDEGVHERLLRFTERFRLGSARLDAEEMETPELRAACAAEATRHEAAFAELEALGGNLLGAFSSAAEEGRVELIASAATHAVLPLMATRSGRRMQVETGLRSHTRRFGRPLGFWLPECAYASGLEELLANQGIEHFCVDQSGHEAATDALTPVEIAKLTAFTIDWEAVQWLWSLDGYPSDPAYADFHRKSWRGTRAWSIGGDAYDPTVAAARAAEQGTEFATACAARLRDHRERTGEPGLITFAIDTELIGHWWWEGPIWLAAALRALPAAGVRPLKLSEARRAHPGEARPLRRSSWGEGKDLRTWDSPRVADLAWGVRRLELRLLREAAGGLRGEALIRAARELLAAQASDWAFLDHRGEAGDYAYQRVLEHSEALFEAIECDGPVDPQLRNLAPDLSLAPMLEP